MRRRSRDFEQQIHSLERRVEELRDGSARAATDLIRGAGEERRFTRRPNLDRMFRRVQAEVVRLEEEARLEGQNPTPEEIERHLEGIERQLQDVLEEREDWVRESLQGRRRRAEDLRSLDWLREEQERLTAELLRCASLLEPSQDEGRAKRRVWKMLRLSGT